jgi:hypothetical protein
MLVTQKIWRDLREKKERTLQRYTPPLQRKLAAEIMGERNIYAPLITPKLIQPRPSLSISQTHNAIFTIYNIYIKKTKQ